LPPPPPPEDEHSTFGQLPARGAGIVPEDHHLPGWVPKNYIEKGEILQLLINKIII